MVGIDARVGIPGDSPRYFFQESYEFQSMTAVALIGDTTHAEFVPLIRWIRQEFPAIAPDTFVDVAAWESAGGGRQKHWLTLVLQSRSDQLAPRDVERLVGATLFSGLFCCYGSWCEGDGRTRHIWPVSSRVPVRYAKQVIQEELRRQKCGRVFLPPTAARGEVFLHRQWNCSAERVDRKGTALVISADRVYRVTFSRLMESSGWDVTAMGPDPDQLQRVPLPHLLVHDLDPQGDTVRACLRSCVARFPDTEMFAITHMPQRLQAVAGCNFPMVPKLDPFLAVKQIEELSQVSGCR